MKIRIIVKEDIPLIASWNVQLHEDEGSVPMSVGAASERLDRWLADDIFFGVVFLVDEKAAGYAFYERRSVRADQRGSEAIYIRQFFIARDSRRKGLGRAAFDLFLRDVVPGDARVVLEVKSTNPTGQRFWASLGFEAESVAYQLVRTPEV